MTSRRLWVSMLLAVLVLGSGSCTSDRQDIIAGPSNQSVSPDLGSGLLGTGIGEGLLSCRPLPYAVTRQEVGPEGGVLRVGPHVLVIPAGALRTAVTITAEAPSDRVNSVRLFPEGLHFQDGHPARLTLSYSNCSLLGRLLPKHIAYTTDDLRILALLLSIDDMLHKRVSADLEHFSRYAVAW